MDSSVPKLHWRRTATHREYRALRRWDFRTPTDKTALAIRRRFRSPRQIWMATQSRSRLVRHSPPVVQEARSRAAVAEAARSVGLAKAFELRDEQAGAGIVPGNLGDIGQGRF